MGQVTFRDIIYTNNKSLCNCLIKKGMTLEQALDVICDVTTLINERINLDAVKMQDLGITCKDELKKNLLALVINKLIAGNKGILDQIGTFKDLVNSINQNITGIKDEFVKVSKDDTAGYLKDKLITNQPGSISVTDDFKILITGFVPVGAQMMISKSRIGDFDNTGKGKRTTDLYGYAISNGANGTTNRLGLFSKYTSDVANAGDKDGSNTYTLKAENIPSLTIPVSGTIQQGLGPVAPVSKLNINYINDGAGGSTPLLRHTPGNNGSVSQPGNTLELAHSHAFNLNAKITNTAIADIAIIPEHILEIPIERITV